MTMFLRWSIETNLHEKNWKTITVSSLAAVPCEAGRGVAIYLEQRRYICESGAEGMVGGRDNERKALLL
jgi:hypothetical protein